MRYPHALRHLPLPVAAVLGIALAVACSDNGLPTGTRKLDVPAPALTITVAGDDDGAGNCPNGTKPFTVTPSTGADANGNGIICVTGGGGGGKKKRPPKK
jgi:hypothetical protein